MTVFTKYLVTFDGRDAVQAAAAIRETSKYPIWGVWAGMFGIASNELIVMTTTVSSPDFSPDSSPDRAADNLWPARTRLVSHESLRATVRPMSNEPLTRDGLYVFRSFYLDAAHIDRVVALSQEAWQTFETSTDYKTEPIGLFAPTDPAPDSTMYLLTWYDGLASWSTSRNPHADARAIFRERHALLHSTTAVATRLLV